MNMKIATAGHACIDVLGCLCSAGYLSLDIYGWLTGLSVGISGYVSKYEGPLFRIGIVESFSLFSTFY